MLPCNTNDKMRLMDQIQLILNEKILTKLREIHRIKLLFIQVDDLGLPVLNANNIFMRYGK